MPLLISPHTFDEGANLGVFLHPAKSPIMIVKSPTSCKPVPYELSRATYLVGMAAQRKHRNVKATHIPKVLASDAT